jgi:hypothetical protein
MTSLTEEARLIALGIVALNRDRTREIDRVRKQPPISWEDREGRRFAISQITNRYAERYITLWDHLLTLLAADERDGLRFLNPVEPKHVVEARELIYSLS